MYSSFNPTLVRLRPHMVLFCVALVGRFNPTLVRLRRPPGACVGWGRGEGFNPTLVRLRLRDWWLCHGGGVLVSIPRWFD